MRLNKVTVFSALLVLVAGVLMLRAVIVPANGFEVSPYRPVVVIDAGHGGFDGGAVGQDGTVEKEINLAISLKLQALAELYGYETIMIRSEDTAVHDGGSTTRERKVSDIHNRLKVAKDHPDAIYVSIHQNKFPESKYWGTQVFYSPNNTGSDDLAKLIQDNVRINLQPDNKREIKKAEKNLYVLYHTENPAVLVECGFLSNETERELLKDEEYQQKLAFCILSSLIEYEYRGQEVPMSQGAESRP